MPTANHVVQTLRNVPFWKRMSNPGKGYDSADVGSQTWASRCSTAIAVARKDEVGSTVSIRFSCRLKNHIFVNHKFHLTSCFLPFSAPFFRMFALKTAHSRNAGEHTGRKDFRGLLASDHAKNHSAMLTLLEAPWLPLVVPTTGDMDIFLGKC